MAKPYRDRRKRSKYTKSVNVPYFFSKLGRFEEAIESSKQAIRIKPDYAGAHCTLGKAYDKLGRFEEAIESSKQAIRIKPDSTDAHCNLGKAYGSLGRYQDEVEALKQAIRIFAGRRQCTLSSWPFLWQTLPLAGGDRCLKAGHQNQTRLCRCTLLPWRCLFSNW